MQILPKTPPQGVRYVIYSFLHPTKLISTISILNIKEREGILTSEVLDQERVLTVKLN